jgi:prophage regulatory protein
MTPLRLIPTAVVLDRISMSKPTLYRLINAGEFPKPVPVGRQRVAFVESEVQSWIDQRVGLRDAPGTGPRTRERARAIAEECLGFMRAAFPDGPWDFTINIGRELCPVVTRTFRATQEEKAMRWLVRELERPGTSVSVGYVNVGRRS